MTLTKTKGHITGVGTVGVPVRDQDRALEFYVGALGLELRFDGQVGNERWIEVAPPGSPTTIALVRGPDQVRMGIDAQVRLTTDEVEAVHADLRARGLDVDVDIVRRPRPSFTVRDPDKNRIMIVQTPVES